uniref:Uncharacterized protein n=1 Tax=Amicula sp. isolate GU52X-4 cfCalB7 TaxID=3003489 RepID=A0A9E9C181_9STRA|nr:hypothetical protein [Amicula sp. isolate GU52X-4 cfCalB7]
MEELLKHMKKVFKIKIDSQLNYTITVKHYSNKSSQTWVYLYLAERLTRFFNKLVFPGAPEVKIKAWTFRDSNRELYHFLFFFDKGSSVANVTQSDTSRKKEFLSLKVNTILPGRKNPIRLRSKCCCIVYEAELDKKKLRKYLKKVFTKRTCRIEYCRIEYIRPNQTLVYLSFTNNSDCYSHKLVLPYNSATEMSVWKVDQVDLDLLVLFFDQQKNLDGMSYITNIIESYMKNIVSNVGLKEQKQFEKIPSTHRASDLNDLWAQEQKKIEKIHSKYRSFESDDMWEEFEQSRLSNNLSASERDILLWEQEQAEYEDSDDYDSTEE